MEYLLIPIVALLASALTFFSGFGLGTLLLPAFALFFPVDVAIALTAIVHFLNNTFKFVLVKNHIDWKIAVQFGIPALIFALLGAFLLDKITNANILGEYTIREYVFQITLMKVIVAILLIFFALFELLPKLKNLQFPKKYLISWHKIKKIILLSAILMLNRIHMAVFKIIIMVQLRNKLLLTTIASY